MRSVKEIVRDSVESRVRLRLRDSLDHDYRQPQPSYIVDAPVVLRENVQLQLWSLGGAGEGGRR